MPERRLRGTHMGSSTMQPEVTRIFPSPRTRTCHLAQPGGPGAKIQSWATNSETAWCPTRSEGMEGASQASGLGREPERGKMESGQGARTGQSALGTFQL